MKRVSVICLAVIFLFAATRDSAASGYTVDTTIPLAGGCPQADRMNISLASPLSPRWSTSLPTAQPILTVAAEGSSAQLTEIGQVISQSFGVWAGVTGTTFNETSYPGLVAPLATVSDASACTNDAETNIDGLDTICFNQSSTAFTSGVLAFTRVITANEPGASVGASGPAAFAGQVLDADTLFCNTGLATFATPGALSTTQGQGAYDLQSVLVHELGHWFGLDHSAVWRAIMFPYAPPPGEFLGERPTVQAPDGPLADDDRTGIRAQYPDPNDTEDVGSISGRILPANPFALASIPAPSLGGAVTGIFGAHVVAVDAGSGSVIAGTLGGWSCGVTSASTQFDGSFAIQRLPVGHSYILYAEPLDGLVVGTDFGDVLGDLCAPGATPACTAPNVDINFNPRILPASP
jgi:hypothetical protein